ncbi:GNAT family N-acetyltransferase [Pseudomonas turukhanskensis]|uniref:N-acetyltransferase n=1 Tax=Pseudomonas turukhanskensis TaxID=1806536 RepID=A0A9W6NF66_9PSED|nr:GNAT family N-acetyltransferase [Pseudomonas turukhanskensis]GLK88527.1 N-acetyltransferase [Pseudomonas turukhanskensis]
MLSEPLTVRAALPADVPALLELMRALAVFEDYIEAFRLDERELMARAFGDNPQCQLFVAAGCGKLAGYAVLLEIPFTFDLRPTLVLKELYIAEAFRGEGLGKALMQKVAQWGTARHAGRLKWDVLAGNNNAEAFYQRLGGRPDSKWRAYQMDDRALQRLADRHAAIGQDGKSIEAEASPTGDCVSV